MQFLINASGKTLITQNKSYVDEAKNEQEAEAKAVELFTSEYNLVDDSIVISKSFDKNRTNKLLAAAVLVLISVIISCIRWELEPMRILWIVKERSISISPELVSCLYAILFYFVYVVRFKGIQKTVSSVIDIVMSVLNILLISSFFQIILTANNLHLLGFIPLDFMPTEGLVLIGFIMSIIGLKFVSVTIYSFIAILAISNLHQVSKAMGAWGVVYIMCAFFGILLWLSVEPCVVEMLPKLKRDVISGAKYIKKDFDEVKNQLPKGEE